MIPSLACSLTNTKLWSFYGDVGQDSLFILWFNVMSELMFPSLTGKKLESLYGDVYVGQDGLFIFRLNVMSKSMFPSLTGSKFDVSLFRGVPQSVLFIFIVKCNDGAVVPQPNWYQD